MTTDRSLTDATDRLHEALGAARDQGASAAKIHLTRTRRIGCEFQNGRLKDTDSEQRQDYEIEVLIDGHRGETSGNDLADLDEMVRRAVTLARVGSVAHFDVYPGPAATATVARYSSTTAAFQREAMIEGCTRMVEALKAYDAELFIEAGADRSEGEELLVTSGGVTYHGRGTRWALGCGVQRTHDTDMLFAHEWRRWRDLNDLYDPDHLSGQVIEDLRHAENTVEAPTGRVTVLLDPRMTGALLQAVALGVNGRNVAKGDSPLRGRRGEQVLDPGLTLVDDPHLDHAPGATEIDADGIPTRRVTVVDRGVLASFLYDLDSAGLAGTEPTGHTDCRMYSPELAPGPTSSQDLRGSIDDGLYIKGLIGFGQSNLINGDFSGNVALGYRIRGGEIVGRVKNTMVSGNVYDLLKQDVRVSADRDPVLRMPYLVVEGLNCSAG